MKIGTLFSGLGAPEFAAKELSECEIAYACDNDPYAKTTYLHNHAPGVFYDDVSQIEKLPKVDLLVFGFPCQPFSMAGKRGGMDDIRGRLVFKAIDLIKSSRPNFFIAENVEGFCRNNNGRALQEVLNCMRGLGYCVEYGILNSLDFGLPQSRRRLWIVGSKKKRSGMLPVGNMPYKPLCKFLDKKTSDTSAYATKLFLEKPKVQQALKDYAHDYIPCITQTISRNGSSSEYISYVAAVWQAIKQTRKPTVQETMRLFGLDDCRFPESVCTTRRYAMLANSMAVPVIKAIMEKIL
jgi:DNA (cytosine-5)-methyltransferase 1